MVYSLGIVDFSFMQLLNIHIFDVALSWTLDCSDFHMIHVDAEEPEN